MVTYLAMQSLESLGANTFAGCNTCAAIHALWIAQRRFTVLAEKA